MFDIDDAYYSLLKFRFSETKFNDLLMEIPFDTNEVVVYGKRHKIPREECFMVVSENVNYKYSGKDLRPIALTPTVNKILEEVNELTDRKFNSVLANFYRNGSDKMGYHKDNEPELGVQPVVVSVSFGGSRYFNFKKEGEKAHKVLLEHGDVFIMKTGFQNEFSHAVPPSKTLIEPRISLTFREILT